MIDVPRPASPTPTPAAARAQRGDAAPPRAPAEPSPGDRFRHALKRLGQARDDAGPLAVAEGWSRPEPLPGPVGGEARPDRDDMAAVPPPAGNRIDGAPAPSAPPAGAAVDVALADADRFERALDAAARTTETQITLPAGCAAREVTLAVAADGNASMSLDMDMDERGRHADPTELTAPLARLGIRLIETEVLARRMREAGDNRA
ncbi:hypothetical protein GO308_00380 [Sphingomonas sp. SFZ2018-12]|uniref:hypothetical protein n=1 Tax=Sphingomonas sp. SFZ2018-12 TaxID=2683197 RepID=UPI001F0FD959|nr:hypothetical protein [Sphingomonas sp. SFZ2018-12]MCH4891562.1 hypothetical protein [Sphingomonas sp. SFZ2018-12]